MLNLERAVEAIDEHEAAISASFAEATTSYTATLWQTRGRISVHARDGRINDDEGDLELRTILASGVEVVVAHQRFYVLDREDVNVLGIRRALLADGPVTKITGRDVMVNEAASPPIYQLPSLPASWTIRADGTETRASFAIAPTEEQVRFRHLGNMVRGAKVHIDALVTLHRDRTWAERDFEPLHKRARRGPGPYDTPEPAAEEEEEEEKEKADE